LLGHDLARCALRRRCGGIAGGAILRRILLIGSAARDSRTQPCETGVPRRPSDSVPWIACPTLVKKIECGIGASSNSFE
jgi:hypothetical protein